MAKDQLILESAYSGNAKFYLYLLFAIIFLPAVVTLPQAIFVNSLDQNEGISFNILIQIIMIVCLSVFGIVFFPLKKGLYSADNAVYFGFFSWGKLIYKYRINLEMAKAISILKFKRRERGAYLSIANPEYSSAYNSFEVYALNERHTERKIIIPLKKEEYAKKALEFLAQHTFLREEIYSPDFS